MPTAAAAAAAAAAAMIAMLRHHARAAAAAVAPETFHQDAPYHSGLADAYNHTPADASQPALKHTRSSAIADGPRDASCQLKSCRLPRNSAETTCTTSPEQIEVMKLEG